MNEKLTTCWIFSIVSGDETFFDFLWLGWKRWPVEVYISEGACADRPILIWVHVYTDKSYERLYRHPICMDQQCHAQTYTHTHAHIFPHTHKWIHSYVHVYIHLHVRMHTRKWWELIGIGKRWCLVKFGDCWTVILLIEFVGSDDLAAVGTMLVYPACQH